ncbi:hypothetical protein [Vibrio cortegadensis]|uniref:hypothetical protein n=1 Tax=Vibrio cortegadensis TaxID=1328770 RepID=UPI00352C8A50
MEKALLKIVISAALLMAISHPSLSAELKQDTYPYIACSVIELSIAKNGGEADTDLASYYISGGLLNEYLDRGHSLDEISRILEIAYQSQPSQQKQYHQSIVASINETVEFFEGWTKDEGIDTLAEWENQRDNEWMCLKKVKPNLMEMNGIFHFMN